VRVIGPNGENLGILPIEEALKKAEELNLDLIEISANAQPPVTKIMDYGKYIYQEEKKKREVSKKVKTVETKNIQMGIGTSSHDMERLAKKIEKFFDEGHRVKIDMILRGRAKAIDKNFVKERIKNLLNLINRKYKVSDDLKSTPRGLSMIIEKEK